jgi:hypothetical protein
MWLLLLELLLQWLLLWMLRVLGNDRVVHDSLMIQAGG